MLLWPNMKHPAWRPSPKKWEFFDPQVRSTPAIPMGLAPSMTASWNIGKAIFAAANTCWFQSVWTTGTLETPA